MPPLVSIIMPAYNCEKYIEDAICSVLNQTYQEWEHIIVDDASTDGTFCIIQKYVRKDARIKVISIKKNSGVSNARNIGITAARGDYIAFLDSDDQWKRNKLEYHIKYMLENDLQFSYTAYEVVDENGKHIKNIVPAKMRVNYQQLLCTNVIACCTIVMESQLIKNEKMPDMKHEDYATWLNILKKNDIEAVGMGEVLSIYRKVKTSVSANKWKTIGWNWRIYYENQQLGFFRSLKYLVSFIVLTGIKYLKK